MKKDRLLCMLKLFLENDEYISAKSIANTLGVSIRTIYNDLDSREFATLLNGANIERKTNVGLKLCATKAHKEKLYFALDSNSAIKLEDTSFNDLQEVLFALLMHSEPLSIDELSMLLYKSKNAIPPILNQCETYVAIHDCHISRKPNFGVQIHGDELKIRLIFRILIQEHCKQTQKYITSFLISFFDQKYIEIVKELITISEELLNTHYTDYDTQILTIKFCVMVKRIQLGFSIHTPYAMDNALQEYYIAAILKMKIEEAFHISLTRQDQCEIAEAILATRKTVNIRTNLNTFDERVIEKFISKISDHLDVPLYDNEELKINLINHLRPAIRRIKYGTPSENPLLNHIRFKFTYVYIAVMITIDEIENQEHIFFDANELSFICLHIVAALNRKASGKIIHTLLINNDGLTLSNYIQSCLEKQFSEIKIEAIMNSDELQNEKLPMYDLVLNTTYDQYQGDHIIDIHSIVEEQDFATIRHWLYYRELENVMNKKDHLKDYILMFHDDETDKCTLLRKYCGYLVDTGYVKKDFYNSVIEREHRSTTSIGRGVAVPHGSAHLVIKPVILIIHTKTKIIWDELEADMIFLTALDDKQTAEYHYFFKQLFQVIEDEKLLDSLKHSGSMADIEKLLFPSK